MSLFQKSVLNKYLKSQNQAEIDTAYALFTSYFHNSDRQENIRNSKEEQFQEGFLRELFVNILGYTLNPEPDFNLTTELKNEKGAKKTDGAILKDGKAHAVIELKGTDTTDLEKITQQAFGYKNNHTDCIYVVTSNFEKLRFYIHNAVEHIEFNLFTLTKEEFSILWLCLQVGNILSNTPLNAKDESLVVEENITKQLYKDYSSFKNELWQNVCKNDPSADKLILFKKTQKLLDRFLFIFFAEDSGLLPPNSIPRMVERYEQLIELDASKPLYDIFKQYFGYINVGRTGKTSQDDIFAYNGGLFIEDPVLDNFVIDDAILKKYVLKLSAYDFQSDVDVNILGHIFENSLNDIENVTAQLLGQDVEKSKTKRKKDGVFYTPKYITKYIVDNTIGKLCREKKAELGVVDEEYAKGRRKRKKETIKNLDTTLQAYRQWLLGITVCDPACGSGAFLNQALEFLMTEHAYIDELESQLLGHAFEFPGVENHILEKNIFGVDINDESVEIAKLSLWLRTAQRGRKLNSLNNNIKCGNSLIDDPEVDPDKAFSWQEAFPTVFEKGGFDVVIGNPPYVKRQNLSQDEHIIFLEHNYQSATYNFDLYLLFIELGTKLIKSDGLVSYINPSKFTSTKTGQGLREYLKSNCNIDSYIDFKEFQIFDDATTYCCIFIISNNKWGETNYIELNPLNPKEIYSYDNSFIFIKESSSGIGWQFKDGVVVRGEIKVKDVCNIFTGIETGADNIFIIPKSKDLFAIGEDPNKQVVHSVLKGANANRYFYHEPESVALVPYKKDKSLIPKEELQKSFPLIWEYLISHQDFLVSRDKGRMNTDKWYGFVYPKNLHKYSTSRIIWSDISIRPQFSIDNEKNWHVRTLCSLQLTELGLELNYDLEILLGIFNSKLLHYYILNNSNTVRGGYLRYRPQYLKEFPLQKKLPDGLKTNLKLLVIKIIGNAYDLHNKLQSLIKLLEVKFSIEKASKKLQNWHELEFMDFLKELKKVNKELSLSEEAEWMQYFTEQKQKA